MLTPFQELVGVVDLLTRDGLTDDRLGQIDIQPDGYYAISFLVLQPCNA